MYGIFAILAAIAAGLLYLIPKKGHPTIYTLVVIALIIVAVVNTLLQSKQWTRIEKKIDQITGGEKVVYSEAKGKPGFDVSIQEKGSGEEPKSREFTNLSYYRISMSTSWASYDDGMLETRVTLFSKKAFLGKKYIFDFISRDLTPFKNRMSLFFESFDETNFLSLQIFTMSALSFTIREDVSGWELGKPHYIAITWQPTKGIINLFLHGKLSKSYEAKDVAFELDKPFLFLGSDYQGKHVGQFKIALPR